MCARFRGLGLLGIAYSIELVVREHELIVCSSCATMGTRMVHQVYNYKLQNAVPFYILNLTTLVNLVQNKCISAKRSSATRAAVSSTFAQHSLRRAEAYLVSPRLTNNDIRAYFWKGGTALI